MDFNAWMEMHHAMIELATPVMLAAAPFFFRTIVHSISRKMEEIAESKAQVIKTSLDQHAHEDDQRFTSIASNQQAQRDSLARIENILIERGASR